MSSSLEMNTSAGVSSFAKGAAEGEVARRPPGAATRRLMRAAAGSCSFSDCCVAEEIRCGTDEEVPCGAKVLLGSGPVLPPRCCAVAEVLVG